MLDHEQISRQKDRLLSMMLLAKSKSNVDEEIECLNDAIEMVSALTIENKDLLKERIRYRVRDSWWSYTDPIGNELLQFIEYL